MFKAGIIDPVKVVRTALANAASIAALMLTTEALVTNFDEEDGDKKRIQGSIAWHTYTIFVLKSSDQIASVSIVI